MLPDLSGQRLDPYLLLRLLGSGLGQVYLAEDHRQMPPSQVALKLLTSLTLSPQDGQSFVEAARSLLLCSVSPCRLAFPGSTPASILSAPSLSW